MVVWRVGRVEVGDVGDGGDGGNGDYGSMAVNGMDAAEEYFLMHPTTSDL